MAISLQSFLKSLMPNSHVISDGLACFRGIAAAGYENTSIVTGGGKSCVKIGAFRWINTVLGNVKNALTGTYHVIRKQHASRYLAEFECRFNRRYDLPHMLDRLLFSSVKTTPMPNRLLKSKTWLRATQQPVRILEETTKVSNVLQASLSL